MALLSALNYSPRDYGYAPYASPQAQPQVNSREKAKSKMPQRGPSDQVLLTPTSSDWRWTRAADRTLRQRNGPASLSPARLNIAVIFLTAFSASAMDLRPCRPQALRINRVVPQQNTA